ncbi:alpha/beta hydrolase [Rhizorhabdus sp.]|uniref:alpha/beta hydrolase n=2 Tax=Rhizorhabdus sp. TaxID=1968843 RepID=UPI001B788FBE|nr:alpha/beta hydrolase [Rhizorhabdus sp.]
MIDPALQQMIDAMAASGFALPDPLEANAMRAMMDNPMPMPPVEVAEVRDVEVDGAAGPLPARLYHPKPGETLPVAVLFHGGGWVVGTLETHDALARKIAQEAGCAVLSVGYRLAPEHPFPAPLLDCVAAVEGLPARAASFGVDRSRYALVGDSAGGNLAAATALSLRGKPHAPLAQVLFYPVIDNDFDNGSYRANAAGGFLSNEMMVFFWKAYVGDAQPSELAAPIRAKDLSGLPPATIILAGNDPLHDEGFAYAMRLREAGVPTDLHDFSGGIHGFASFFGLSPIADQAVALGAAALKRAFA